MFHNKEYVYEIYRSRSFSKAAEKLHISQPALSSAVRKIEDRAGAPIFERTTRPISLTPFGIEYMQCVQRILTMEEHLHTIAYELQNQPRGVVRIGCSNLGSNYVIPKRFAEFKQMYPEVTLQVLEGTTLGSKAMLDEGIVDLIITNRPLPTDEYERRICYKEQLLAAVPQSFSINKELREKALSSHELGKELFHVPREKAVSLAVFRDEPFVLLLRENYLRLCCDLMFQDLDMLPNIAMEVENQSIAVNFAALGNGITIISNMLVHDLADRCTLNFYKLDTPRADRDAFVCCRKGRFMTNAMQKLVEVLTR